MTYKLVSRTGSPQCWKVLWDTDSPPGECGRGEPGSDLSAISRERFEQWQAMAAWEMLVLDCSPVTEKLKEYKACPSPPGMAWAHISWHDPKAVADRITTLTKE